MRLFLLLPLLSISTLVAAPLEHHLYHIREPQTNREAFRGHLKEIGKQIALSIAERLPKEEKRVVTCLGQEAIHFCLKESPVLITILRAGLPLNEGALEVFPDAEVGFLGMARNEETLEAHHSYVALPQIEGKRVIVTDTMLATGGSMINALEVIKEGKPEKIYVLCALAAAAGIEKLKQYDSQVEVIAAFVDPVLNEKGYIVPGLGDAGDRSFGNKNRENR
jgi:uracil phosphoribosyltransferase